MKNNEIARMHQMYEKRKLSKGKKSDTCHKIKVNQSKGKTRLKLKLTGGGEELLHLQTSAYPMEINITQSMKNLICSGLNCKKVTLQKEVSEGKKSHNHDYFKSTIIPL